jgi:predicted GNAT family acetyltransferase
LRRPADSAGASRDALAQPVTTPNRFPALPVVARGGDLLAGAPGGPAHLVIQAYGRDCSPIDTTAGQAAASEWNEVVTMATTVSEIPERHRYEISVDGALAGFTGVTLDGDVAIMPHTKIDPAYEGQGLATTLIRAALDDVRARGLTVVPRCPFVRDFIDKNPDYQDLVGR